VPCSWHPALSDAPGPNPAAPRPAPPLCRDEDVSIVDSACHPSDAWAAACYGADGCGDAGGGGAGGGVAEGPREPVFSPELGLAVEAIRDPAVTVRQLWCVL
jgi:hypothetical protein